MQTEARQLYDAGFNIMPLNGKRPVGEWGRLQNERANLDRIVDYLAKNPGANLAIVCGHLSGVAVIDIDVKPDTDLAPIHAFMKKYPTPLAVRTGGGGFHLYYQHRPLKNAVRINYPGIAMDVRSQGGYVVCPPSIHPETKRLYAFISCQNPEVTYEGEDVYPLRESCPPFPEEIATLCSASTGKTPDDWRAIIHGTNEGSRNYNAASLAGKLINLIPATDWNSVAWPLIFAWNQTYVRPPLPESELRSTFESICKTALRKREWGENSTMKPL